MTNTLGYEPLFARVLLEREKKEVTTGGIIIPEQAQTKHAPEYGRVVAMGPTVDESIKSLMGKTVYFAKFAGAWIKVEGKDYFICQDEDILLGEAV